MGYPEVKKKINLNCNLGLLVASFYFGIVNAL